MSRTNRLLTISNILLASILVLVMVQFAPSVANAGSTTIVACASKESGALRVAYKKCNRNENPLSWGQIGPQGPAGPPGDTGPAGVASGSNAVIKDANGDVVAGVISVMDEYVWFSKLTNDGLWKYSMKTGLPFVNERLNLAYQDSSCTGPNIMAYYESDNSNLTIYTTQFRAKAIQLGGQEAFFKLDSTSTTSASGLTYTVDNAGQCVTFEDIGMDNPLLGISVSSVPAPLPIPAPLTFALP